MKIRSEVKSVRSSILFEDIICHERDDRYGPLKVVKSLAMDTHDIFIIFTFDGSNAVHFPKVW